MPPKPWSRSSILAATLAACAAVHAADPPAWNRPARNFEHILGLQMKFSQGQPLGDLPIVGELGVRWVRDTVSWRDMEPVAGRYADFPKSFSQRLSYYREHDVGLIFILAFGNERAYPAIADQRNRDIDPVAFGRYAAAMARKLRASGVKFVLEIWNEPHNFVLKPRLGGMWNGQPPSPWLKHYVRMAREAVTQVKAVDPTIKLLSDDDMWVIHYWFLEAGLPPALDGFAFHPYVNKNCVGPEMTPVDKLTEWVRPFTVVDSDRSFRSAVRLLREQGRRKLGHDPEMWVTEWGWALGQETPFGPVTENSLAGLLPRAFIVAEAAGVENVTWFSARDTVDGPMGLIANDGRRRLSFQSYRTLGAELGAYQLVRQVIGEAHPRSGLQAFLFKRGNTFKLAIWTIGATKPIVIPRGGIFSSVTAIDALGKVLSRDAALPLSAAPLYLTGIPGDARLDASLAGYDK